MTMIQDKEAESTNSAQEIASTVKRLGNPISTILLDSPCRIFQMDGIDGIIGYQLVRNCAVVLGDPICLPEYTAKLSQAFQLHCQKSNWRMIYFLVSDSFAHWAINNGFNTLIQTGEELIIDPTSYQKKQKVRWKIKQSITSGVVIKEYKQFDAAIEYQLKNTIHAWLKEKQGPQIHLGDLNYSYSEKRIFYAMQNDKIIGLLKLSPIERYHGWALSSFLALSAAPVGTSEHLLNFTFDTLASENCHFLCLGVIAGTQLGEMIGLNVFSKFFAHLIFKISKMVFKLDARMVYLFKYRPRLSPTYFLISGKLKFRDLMALKDVLNVRICFQ